MRRLLPTVRTPRARAQLIPFLDMFNHHAATKHYLTGRTPPRRELCLTP